MRRTLLFADNERGIRQYCREELEADGFRVVLAEDGEEAVNLLDRETIDLAILDEYMPRCNGRESAERIKRLHAELPVILFTADSYFEAYQSPQVDATVIKSADLGDLKAAIARLMPKLHRESASEEMPWNPRLAVNAAFFQEIKQENVRLSSLLASFKTWLDRGASLYHQRERFIELLSTIRDELSLHFSLEEGFGYFEDAVAVAPELSLRAARLREDHVTLYLQLSRLAHQASSTSSSLSGFADLLSRGRAFLDQLLEHELRERELILGVYNDEFGVGD